MVKEKKYNQHVTGLTAKTIRDKLLKNLRAGNELTEHQRDFLISAFEDIENGRKADAAFGLIGSQGRCANGMEVRNFYIVQTIDYLLNEPEFVTGENPGKGKENVFEFVASTTKFVKGKLSTKRIERIYYDNREHYYEQYEFMQSEPNYD